MLISKSVELKKFIGQLFIRNGTKLQLPQTMTYSRGVEFPKYKITIEEYDEDFFIDSNGTKWMKVKEEDKKVVHDTKSSFNK